MFAILYGISRDISRDIENFKVQRALRRFSGLLDL
jgi:hypothetical protein